MSRRLRLALLLAVSLWCTPSGGLRRVPSPPRRAGLPVSTALSTRNAVVNAEMQAVWELDFYSRPVQGADGKKLWELLVTDGAGTFRHVEAVPSNCVNSRELRTRVQRLIDDADVRPTTIRFFRAQMKNMITIALSELSDVACKPSRVTYALYDWLDERERDVYPGMPGYRKPRPDVRVTPTTARQPVRPRRLVQESPACMMLPQATSHLPRAHAVAIALGVATKPHPRDWPLTCTRAHAIPSRVQLSSSLKLPVRLPEQLRGEQYAVATLPLAEFLPGGSINVDNIGFGSLCPLPPMDGLTPDSMVAGVVIFSRRSRAIAAWLTGLDLAFLSAVLESREFYIEVCVHVARYSHRAHLPATPRHCPPHCSRPPARRLNRLCRHCCATKQWLACASLKLPPAHLCRDCVRVPRRVCIFLFSRCSLRARLRFPHPPPCPAPPRRCAPPPCTTSLVLSIPCADRRTFGLTLPPDLDARSDCPSTGWPGYAILACADAHAYADARGRDIRGE